MDTTITNEVPTAAGTPFAGGFYAGRIAFAGAVYAIVVSPKAGGEHEAAPLGPRKGVNGTTFMDGRSNTLLLAEAGSELAAWARALDIGGFADWYIPSRDELELCYRALKPTTWENHCYRGDNPSSVPVGYAYMPHDPAQTIAEAFREGGTEAFETEWYWSSTQCAGRESSAWVQTFTDGHQNHHHKSYVYHARAVRREVIQ